MLDLSETVLLSSQRRGEAHHQVADEDGGCERGETEQDRRGEIPQGGAMCGPPENETGGGAESGGGCDHGKARQHRETIANGATLLEAGACRGLSGHG